MPYFYVDGFRGYYEVEGDGSPLIMIHGASQDTLSWHDNIPYFSKNYKVFAIDLPGHGKSALMKKQPIRTNKEFADFMWTFIETLKIRKPVLIGHSMGAGIAVSVSIDHPDAIKAVVAIDGGAAFSGPTGVSYQPELLKSVEVNPTDWFETMFLSLVGRTTPIAKREEMAFDVTRCSPYVAFCDLLTYASLNLNGRIDQIKVPIYYITGEDDWSTTPDMVIETSKKLKVKTEVIVLRGIGHIPHWEQPEKFNEALESVLKKIG
ncbi:MAG: alpha/beta hydrolase [Pseudomonadota bacterium]